MLEGFKPSCAPWCNALRCRFGACDEHSATVAGLCVYVDRSTQQNLVRCLWRAFTLKGSASSYISPRLFWLRKHVDCIGFYVQFGFPALGTSINTFPREEYPNMPNSSVIFYLASYPAGYSVFDLAISSSAFSYISPRHMPNNKQHGPSPWP